MGITDITNVTESKNIVPCNGPSHTLRMSPGLRYIDLQWAITDIANVTGSKIYSLAMSHHMRYGCHRV
jgi:hypothetical protein